MFKLADISAKSVDRNGGKSIIFNTITVSDGISMGTEGMRYSLVSREIIADSIETVVGCEGFDGFIAIGGCDKNMPGCVMAMARLNRPSIFIYGGTILPGKHKSKKIDIVSVFTRRLLAGNSPFKADVFHMHHLLLHQGFKQKEVLLMLLLFSLLMVVVGVLGERYDVAERVMFFGFLLIFAVYFFWSKVAIKNLKLILN